MAALEPLFARFSELQARIGIADAALEAELSTVLSEYQASGRQQPDGADWKSLQWHCAMVLDSLARPLYRDPWRDRVGGRLVRAGRRGVGSHRRVRICP